MEAKRRPHNRLGYALQLTAVRYLGVFPDDVTQVPGAVAEYLAAQLDITDVGLLVDYETGEILAPPAAASVEAIWEHIEAVVPRRELAAAIAAVLELAPPLDSDAEEAWRAQLVTRFPTVRPFLPALTQVVDFGATPQGSQVLAALRSLPGLLGRKRSPRPRSTPICWPGPGGAWCCPPLEAARRSG